MNFKDFFEATAAGIMADFEKASAVRHRGDMGENREEIIVEQLKNFLPGRYGVIKGMVVNRHGEMSNSIDVILYDALNCPLFYDRRTAILPIEGVYGIIEVKSRLSKEEFLDAARKIAVLKRMAYGEPGVTQLGSRYVFIRPPQPFGVVLGFSLAGNSLDSLADNWSSMEPDCSLDGSGPNFLGVIDAGLVVPEEIDLAVGTKNPILNSVDLARLRRLGRPLAKRGQPVAESQFCRYAVQSIAGKTIGWMYAYILIMLARMKLVRADIGRYLEPDLPILISREE